MQKDTPGQYFLPSEICRLVLGFLKEGGYTHTYRCFLRECVHLREYESLLKKGQVYPTNIMGLSLKMMLEEYARGKLTQLRASSSVLPLSGTMTNTEAQQQATGRSPQQSARADGLRTLPQHARTRALHKSAKGRPAMATSQQIIRQKTGGGTPTGPSTNFSPSSLFDNYSGSESDSDMEIDVGNAGLDSDVPCTSTPAGSGGVLSLSSAITLNLEDTPASGATSSISNTSGFHSDTTLQVTSRQSESQVSNRECRPQSAGVSVSESATCRGAELRGGHSSPTVLSHGQLSGQVIAASPSGAGAKELGTSVQTRTSVPILLLSASLGQGKQPHALQTGSVSSVVSSSDHGKEQGDRGYRLTSAEAPSKRRKKPPRRRSETHSSHNEGNSGGATENFMDSHYSLDWYKMMDNQISEIKSPLNKIINSSRFVKTLVDNINNCLYDSHKHTQPQPPTTTTVDADKRMADPDSEPVPSTSGTVVDDTHGDSLEEEFDFLNKDMTHDTVRNIINMASNDPVFDELFNMFNTDRDEFVKKHSGKGSSAESNQGPVTFGVADGLHTPPHCSAAEADFEATELMAMPSAVDQYPITPSSATPTSTQQSHPAALSFSTECIDLNSMSAFPHIGNLADDHNTPVSSGGQQLSVGTTQVDLSADAPPGSSKTRTAASAQSSPTRGTTSTASEMTGTSKVNLPTALKEAGVSEVSEETCSSSAKQSGSASETEHRGEGVRVRPDQTQQGEQCQRIEAGNASDSADILPTSDIDQWNVTQEPVERNAVTEISDSVLTSRALESCNADVDHVQTPVDLCDTGSVLGSSDGNGLVDTNSNKCLTTQECQSGVPPSSEEAERSVMLMFAVDDNVRSAPAVASLSEQGKHNFYQGDIISVTRSPQNLVSSTRTCLESVSDSRLTSVMGAPSTRVMPPVSQVRNTSGCVSSGAGIMDSSAQLVPMGHQSPPGIVHELEQPQQSGSSSQSASDHTTLERPVSSKMLVTPVSDLVQSSLSREASAEESQPFERGIHTEACAQLSEMPSAPSSGSQQQAAVPVSSSVLQSPVMNSSEKRSVDMQHCSVTGQQVLAVVRTSPPIVSLPHTSAETLTVTCQGAAVPSCAASKPVEVEKGQDSGNIPQGTNVKTLLPVTEQRAPFHNVSCLERLQGTVGNTPLVSSGKVTSSSSMSPVKTCGSHAILHHLFAMPIQSVGTIVGESHTTTGSSGTVMSNSLVSFSSTIVHCSPLMSLSRTKSKVKTNPTYVEPSTSPSCLRESSEVLHLSGKESPVSSVRSLTVKEASFHPEVSSDLNSPSEGSDSGARTSTVKLQTASQQLRGDAAVRKDLASINVHSSFNAMSRHVKNVGHGESKLSKGTACKSPYVLKLLQRLKWRSIRTLNKHRSTNNKFCHKSSSKSNYSISSQKSTSEQEDAQKNRHDLRDRLHTLKSPTGLDKSLVQAGTNRSHKHDIDQDTGVGSPALPVPAKSCSTVAHSTLSLQNPVITQPPGTPPRPKVSGSVSAHELFRTPPRTGIGKSKNITPSTPRRSLPGTPRSVRSTPAYSPIKSPYSPETAAAISSMFSPRRKKLLNDPIPEEVYDEISLHSDANMSDAVSRHESVCSNPEEMEDLDLGGSSTVHLTQQLKLATDSAENQMELSIAPFTVCSLSDTGHGREPRPGGSSECFQHSNSNRSSSCREVGSVAQAPGASGHASDSKSNSRTLLSQQIRQENMVGLTRNSQERIGLEVLDPVFGSSGHEQTSGHASDSSDLNNFRVVGTIETRCDPAQTLAVETVQQQQQGKLINVGAMLVAADDSSRHSATISSTHVMVQVGKGESRSGSSADRVEGLGDSAKTRKDKDNEQSSHNIFLTPEMSEEAGRTNISLPILPFGVAQFLNSQIETGELQVPMDLTNEVTLQKTPTASPEKDTPRKSTPRSRNTTPRRSSRNTTPRRSPRKSTPRRLSRISSVCHLSTQIGHLASMSRREPRSPKKAVSRNLLTSHELTSPRKRRDVGKGRKSSAPHQTRHFASVSQDNSPEPEDAGLDPSCQSAPTQAVGCKESTASQPGSVFNKALTAIQSGPPVTKSDGLSLTKTVERKPPSPYSSESDFSIHSCSTDASPKSEDFSSDDNLPLIEVARKLAQMKQESLICSTDEVKTAAPDKDQQAGHDSQAPKEGKDLYENAADQSCGSPDISTHGEVLDCTMEKRQSRLEDGMPTEDGASVKVPVDGKTSSETAAPRVPASLAGSGEAKSLPFKKRPAGRKNLSLLWTEVDSSKQTDTASTHLVPVKQTAVPPLEAIHIDTSEEENNGHSADSKASCSGSSSAEVDICRLSEDDIDNSKEEFPLLQSMRKRRDITATKKSARKQTSPAQAKTVGKKNVKKIVSVLDNQKTSASSSVSKNSTSKKPSPSSQRKTNRFKKAKQSTVASVDSENRMVKSGKNAVPEPYHPSSERRTSSENCGGTVSLEVQPTHGPESASQAVRPSSVASFATLFTPSDGTGQEVVQHTGMSGGGLGQQNQTYCYTAVQQPEKVGIQQYGPYRRIKPTLISKTTTSYFPSQRGSLTQAGQSSFENESISSSAFTAFSALSQMTAQSELSSGVFFPAYSLHSPWPQPSHPNPSLQKGMSTVSSAVSSRGSVPNVSSQNVKSKSSSSVSPCELVPNVSSQNVKSKSSSSVSPCESVPNVSSQNVKSESSSVSPCELVPNVSSQNVKSKSSSSVSPCESVPNVSSQNVKSKSSSSVSPCESVPNVSSQNVKSKSSSSVSPCELVPNVSSQNVKSKSSSSVSPRESVLNVSSQNVKSKPSSFVSPGGSVPIAPSHSVKSKSSSSVSPSESVSNAPSQNVKSQPSSSVSPGGAVPNVPSHRVKSKSSLSSSQRESVSKVSSQNVNSKSSSSAVSPKASVSKVSSQKVKSKSSTSTVSPSGSVTNVASQKVKSKSPSSTVSPSGSVTNVASQKVKSKSPSSTVSPSGSVAKVSSQKVKSKYPSSTVSPSGSVAKVASRKVKSKSPSSTVSPSGSVSKVASRKVKSKSPSSTVSPSGSVTKVSSRKVKSKSPSSTVSPSGSVTKVSSQKVKSKSPSSTVSPSGSVTKVASRKVKSKSPSSTVSPSGSVSKVASRKVKSKSPSSTVSPSGSVTKVSSQKVKSKSSSTVSPRGSTTNIPSHSRSSGKILDTEEPSARGKRLTCSSWDTSHTVYEVHCGDTAAEGSSTTSDQSASNSDHKTEISAVDSNVVEVHYDRNGKKAGHQSSGLQGSSTAVRKKSGLQKAGSKRKAMSLTVDNQCTSEEMSPGNLAQKRNAGDGSYGDSAARLDFSSKGAVCAKSRSRQEQNTVTDRHVDITQKSGKGPGSDVKGTTGVRRKKKSDGKQNTGKTSSSVADVAVVRNIGDTSRQWAKESCLVVGELRPDAMTRRKPHPTKMTVLENSANAREDVFKSSQGNSGNNFTKSSRSATNISTVERTSQDYIEDLRNSSTKTKKCPVQRYSCRASSKKATTELMEADQVLPTSVPEPVPTETGEAEVEGIGDQRACDSFETEEAAKVLEELHASGLKEDDHDHYSVKTNSQQTKGDGSMETEMIVEMQDWIADGESVLNTVNTESEMVYEAHQSDDMEMGKSEVTKGADGCEVRAVVNSTGDENSKVSKEVSEQVDKVLSQNDNQETCVHEHSSMVAELSEQQSRQQSRNIVVTGDGLDDFELPGVISAPPSQSSLISCTTVSRKRKIKPQQNPVPRKKVRKGKGKEKHSSEGEPDGPLQGPSGQKQTSPNNLKNLDTNVNMPQTSGLLSMPFLGDVSRSPMKMSSIPLQHEPCNVIHIEEKVAPDHGEQTQVTVSDGHTHCIDSGSVINKFSPLLNQLEAEEQNGISMGGPSNKGSENVQNCTENVLKFTGLENIQNYSDTLIQISPQPSKNPMHSTLHLVQELQQMRVAKYRGRTLKRREKKVGSDPKGPVGERKKMGRPSRNQSIPTPGNTLPVPIQPSIRPLSSWGSSCGGNILIVLPQTVPHSEKPCPRQIFPKGESGVDGSSASSSGKAVLNPLEAAVLSELPELAYDPVPNTHPQHPAPAPDSKETTQDNGQHSHKGNIELDWDRDESAVQKIIVVNKSTAVRDGDFSDMTSPQPLVIDDVVNMGAEISLCQTEKLAASKNKKKVSPKGTNLVPPTKKRGQKQNQERKTTKLPERKQNSIKKKALKTLLPEHNSIHRTIDQGLIQECVQGEGRSTQRDTSQQPPLSAQQMFPQIVQPGVSQTVVSEPELEAGWLDHGALREVVPVNRDAVTELVPVSVLPPVLSSSECSDLPSSLLDPSHGIVVQSTPDVTKSMKPPIKQRGSQTVSGLPEFVPVVDFSSTTPVHAGASRPYFGSDESAPRALESMSTSVPALVCPGVQKEAAAAATTRPVSTVSELETAISSSAATAATLQPSSGSASAAFLQPAVPVLTTSRASQHAGPSHQPCPTSSAPQPVPSSKVTRLKDMSSVERASSSALSRGHASPRQEIAEIMVSMDAIENSRMLEGQRQGQTDDHVRTSSRSTFKCSKKTGRLSSLSIDKFLSKVVHK